MPFHLNIAKGKAITVETAIKGWSLTSIIVLCKWWFVCWAGSMLQNHNHNDVQTYSCISSQTLQWKTRQEMNYTFITISFTSRLHFGDIPSLFVALACNMFLSFIWVSRVLWNSCHWHIFHELYLLFITFLYCNLARQDKKLNLKWFQNLLFTPGLKNL